MRQISVDNPNCFQQNKSCISKIFCKNWKLALKICFKATETFEFIFVVFVISFFNLCCETLECNLFGIGSEIRVEETLPRERKEKKYL